MHNERRRVTHLMRAPIVGGSELETLTITRRLTKFDHEVIFPSQFRDMQPSIADQFPPGVPVIRVSDVEDHLRRFPPELLHVQFPFIVDPQANGSHLESVLIFRGSGAVPLETVLFTVHAAVNVPVIPGIHYLFHTDDQATRYLAAVGRENVTIAPSLVEIPDDVGPRAVRSTVQILWVSRNEDAKFHEQVPEIATLVHRSCPEATFRFVGHPTSWSLPRESWIEVESCPATDLPRCYRDADVFWYFPAQQLCETWCRTVTEAMAHSLPCVVADRGALPVQVRHGVDGCVVRTSQETVAALAELVRAAQLRRDMGASARFRAVGFANDAEREIARTYGRMICGRRARTGVT